MATVTTQRWKKTSQFHLVKQQKSSKYHFSFQILSDQNMKMDCHAIFLQRFNLVPLGVIYHFRYAESAETQFTKNFITQKIRWKSRHFTLNTWKSLSILERIWWLNHHFVIKKGGAWGSLCLVLWLLQNWGKLF